MVRLFSRSCPLSCFHCVAIPGRQLRLRSLVLLARQFQTQNRLFSERPRRGNTVLFSVYSLTITLQLRGSWEGCVALWSQENDHITHWASTDPTDGTGLTNRTVENYIFFGNDSIGPTFSHFHPWTYLILLYLVIKHHNVGGEEK